MDLIAGDLLTDLATRSLIHDTTDRDALADRLAAGPIGVYIGFDPTADSLHAGNLVGQILMRRFQLAGHRPFPLAGGATGMVGDPGGRSTERNLLDEETLRHNVACIKRQLTSLLDFEPGPAQATLVNNADWTTGVTMLEFLRDVGKYVTVNQMIAKDSVRSRLDSEHGISYTEFSYMLLQANDYRHLYETHGVELQAGASDQWGNIVTSEPVASEREPQEIEAQAEPPEDPEGFWIATVDSEGEPRADVPVAILLRKDDMPGMPTWHGTTSGSDARIEVRPRTFRISTKSPVTLVAALDLPLEPAVEIELQPETLPGSTVELVVPDEAQGWLAPLRVRVIDAHGEPVVLMPVAFRGVQRNNPDRVNRIGSALSDENGMCVISRQEQTDLLRSARWFSAQFDLEVVCQGPFIETPRTEVPLEPSDETVTIVLPATAPVAVRVLGPDGQKVKDGAASRLSWRPVGEEDARFEGSMSWQHPVEEGRAWFSHVGLGLELRISGWLSSASAESGSLETLGPTVPDVVHEVEVRSGPLMPVFAGRIVGAKREPLASLRFSLAQVQVGGPQKKSYSYHTTDAEGRFEIPFVHRPSELPRVWELAEMPARSGAPPGWIQRFTTFDVPAVVADGERIDAGDLLLENVPLLLAGSVVDLAGRGVKRARLWVTYPKGDSKRPVWSNLNVPTSVLFTGEDGRFEIRGLHASDRFAVYANKGELVSIENVTAPSGAQDLTIVIGPKEETQRPSGSVQGVVLLDGDLPTNLLEVALELSEGGDRDQPLFAAPFHFKHVPDGELSVLVRTHSTDFVLARIDGVRVEGGQQAHDPRLAQIDLRGRTRYLRLKLVRPSGAPIKKKRIRIHGLAGGGQLVTGDSGELVALIPVDASDFAIQLDGQKQQLSWSPGVQTLVFHP